MTYTTTTADDTQTIAVAFSSAIIQIPKIFLSLKKMEDSADVAYDFSHEAQAITVNGFNLVTTKTGTLEITSYII